MTTADYDVLIVGGGLAGASLAARLGQDAWRVAIIDPRTPDHWPGEPTPDSLQAITPRVAAIAPDTRTWLAACGAWQHLPQARCGHYRDMQVWDATGSGDIHFSAAELGLDTLGTIIENAWAEQALWAEILDQAHIDAFTASRADRVRAAGTEPARVTLDTGQELTTRLLVLADGARSPARTQLGMRVQHWDCHQRAVVATVAHSQPHDQIARQSFHRAGPLAFLPLHQAHWSSIVWSLDTAEADRFLDQNCAEQKKQLTLGIGNALGTVTDMTATRTFPLHQMHARDYWQPGVVLLGDTAHQVHPLAGQGANLGLRDAQALYTVLMAARAQGIPLEEPLLLRRYTRARKPHNLAAVAAMEGFLRLFAPDDLRLHSVRNLGLRAFSQLPALRRAAARIATGH